MCTFTYIYLQLHTINNVDIPETEHTIYHSLAISSASVRLAGTSGIKLFRINLIPNIIYIQIQIYNITVYQKSLYLDKNIIYITSSIWTKKENYANCLVLFTLYHKHLAILGHLHVWQPPISIWLTKHFIFYLHDLAPRRNRFNDY